MGSPDSCAAPVSRIAGAIGTQVFSVRYRLAPENPFPAALNDAVTAYKWLIASGVAAERTVLWRLCWRRASCAAVATDRSTRPGKARWRGAGVAMARPSCHGIQLRGERGDRHAVLRLAGLPGSGRIPGRSRTRRPAGVAGSRQLGGTAAATDSRERDRAARDDSLLLASSASEAGVTRGTGKVCPAAAYVTDYGVSANRGLGAGSPDPARLPGRRTAAARSTEPAIGLVTSS